MKQKILLIFLFFLISACQTTGNKIGETKKSLKCQKLRQDIATETNKLFENILILAYSSQVNKHRDRKKLMDKMGQYRLELKNYRASCIKKRKGLNLFASKYPK